MIPFPFTLCRTLQNRNDLRKVLEESDDSLGDVETTKSTTTTTTTPKPPSTTKSKSTTSVTTTKSTTTTTTTTQRSTKRYYAPSKNPSDVPKTPKTYFSNSFYNNNNQNNINGQTDRAKSLFKSVTQEAHFEHSETPTPAPAKSTINPFYYGFNRLPNKNSNNIINTTVRTTSQLKTSPTTQKFPRHLLFTSTARTPYSFQYFTTTKKTDLLASSTQPTNSEIDNNYHENQSPPRDDVETEKPKTSTYNPVFDIYFRQIGRQRTTTAGS